MITAANITDEQIRELRADPSVSPADAWECDIVLCQHKMKNRANKTKARIARARARCAALLNAREAQS